MILNCGTLILNQISYIEHNIPRFLWFNECEEKLDKNKKNNRIYDNQYEFELIISDPFGFFS